MNILGGNYYLIRFMMEIEEERLLGPLFLPRRAFSDCFPQLFPLFLLLIANEGGGETARRHTSTLLSTATLPEGVRTPSPAAIIQVEGAHEIRN